MKLTFTLLAATFVLLAVGCTGSSTESAPQPAPSSDSSDSSNDAGAMRIVIEPGPEAQTEAQEALILAEPGDVIEFAEGTFKFDGTLSIDGVNDVTVRGQGMEKTILNFSGFRSGQGGEGMKVKGDNFVIEDIPLP